MVSGRPPVPLPLRKAIRRAHMAGRGSIAAGRIRVVDLPRIDKPRSYKKGMPKNAPGKALGGARNAE